MGKVRAKQPPRRPSRWRWAVVGGVLAAAIAAFWWMSEAQKPSGGTPRLAVDRTEIDLGYFPFGKWATATFAVSNAGDGVLRLLEVPKVTALKGC